MQDYYKKQTGFRKELDIYRTSENVTSQIEVLTSNEKPETYPTIKAHEGTKTEHTEQCVTVKTRSVHNKYGGNYNMPPRAHLG